MSFHSAARVRGGSSRGLCGHQSCWEKCHCYGSTTRSWPNVFALAFGHNFHRRRVWAVEAQCCWLVTPFQVVKAGHARHVLPFQAFFNVKSAHFSSAHCLKAHTSACHRRRCRCRAGCSVDNASRASRRCTEILDQQSNGNHKSVWAGYVVQLPTLIFLQYMLSLVGSSARGDIQAGLTSGGSVCKHSIRVSLHPFRPWLQVLCVRSNQFRTQKVCSGYGSYRDPHQQPGE